MTTRPHNTIRTFALICVAVTTAFLMGMAVWYTKLVSGRDWCSRAIGAEEAAEGGTRQRSETAVEACMNLLDKQVSILGINSHVLIGILALCLLALMVIVVAGGRMSIKASASGIEADMSSKDDQLAGAKRVEGAAREERETIEEEAVGDPKLEPEPETPKEST